MTINGGGASCLSHIPVDKQQRESALYLYKDVMQGSNARARLPSNAHKADMEEGLRKYNRNVEQARSSSLQFEDSQ